MKAFIVCAVVLVACNGKPTPLCTDADGDGVTAGASKTCGGDCNDNDRNVFRTVTLFTDKDGDGFGTGTGTATCIGLLIPKGFADKAGDCDDTRAGCTSDCTDQDGDGTPACAGDCDDTNPHCIATCIDHDGDGYCADHDCNDDSPLHWDDCGVCVDQDGDGHGTGCDVGGSDCDPNDTDNWDKCSTCVDKDGDQFWTGCDRYVTRQGEDCDDSSAACTLDCQDDDGDKVSACQGDCNDARGLTTACTLLATGAAAEIASVSGGNGGTVNFMAFDTVTLLGSEDPLPAGTFSSGAVPPLAAALAVCTSATSLNLACTGETLTSIPLAVHGLFVPKGVTLTLSGPGPFITTSDGDVFIGGRIVTDTAGARLEIDGDGSHDFTLSGSIDTHAAACKTICAPGCTTVCDGGAVTIDNFAHAAIIGGITTFGADGSASVLSGAGGNVTIHDAQIYLAAPIDAHDGQTENTSPPPAGADIDVNASADLVARLNLTSAGGNALGGFGQVPGIGGGVSLRALNAVTASANVLVTIVGGTATGAGAGGQGGSCTVRAQDGAPTDSVTAPTIIATGGAAASAAGGPGGAVTIAVGNDASSSSRSITIAGRVDVSSGTGNALGAAGTILIESDDDAGAAPATITLNAPLAANGNGSSGERIDIGVFPAPLVSGADYAAVSGDLVAVNASVNTTGLVDFNGSTLSGSSGADLGAATCDYGNTPDLSGFSLDFTGAAVSCVSVAKVP